MYESEVDALVKAQTHLQLKKKSKEKIKKHFSQSQCSVKSLARQDLLAGCPQTHTYYCFRESRQNYMHTKGERSGHEGAVICRRRLSNWWLPPWWPCMASNLSDLEI